MRVNFCLSRQLQKLSLANCDTLWPSVPWPSNTQNTHWSGQLLNLEAMSILSWFGFSNFFGLYPLIVLNPANIDIFLASCFFSSLLESLSTIFLELTSKVSVNFWFDLCEKFEKLVISCSGLRLTLLATILLLSLLLFLFRIWLMFFLITLEGICSIGRKGSSAAFLLFFDALLFILRFFLLRSLKTNAFGNANWFNKFLPNFLGLIAVFKFGTEPRILLKLDVFFRWRDTLSINYIIQYFSRCDLPWVIKLMGDLMLTPKFWLPIN